MTSITQPPAQTGISPRSTSAQALSPHLEHWELWITDVICGYDVIGPSEGKEILELVRAHTEGQDCEHDYRVARLIASDGSTRYIRECLYCWDQLSQQIKKDKLSVEEITSSPLRHDPEDKWAMQQTIRLSMMSYVQQLVREVNNRDYHAYLKSRAWWSRRQRVMQRASYVCEGCLDAPATEVHHTTYNHIFDELLYELVALCRECHEKVHSR